MDLSRLDTITPTEYSRYRYIDAVLNGMDTSAGELCDIGCGVGNHLLAFGDLFSKSMGIDTSDESLELAGKKISSPDITLKKLDAFELDRQFDFIFLTEVLEHVLDDRRLLEHIRKNILKKNGYLLVTVPAHSRLYSQFDNNAGHYMRYYRKEIISLLSGAGFKPLIFWCYGWFLFHIIANSMPLLGEKNNGARIGDKGSSLKDRTRLSSIREFSGIAKVIVSRVNLVHRLCFFMDRIFRKCDFGIEYFIFCKPD